MVPTENSINSVQTCRRIVDFADEHKLVINPAAGYTYYVKNYHESGRCPCDSKRLECPCPEAISDVEKNGCCKCRLFWRDLKTFKESHLKEG